MVLSWEKALAAGCDEESLLQIARLAEVGLSAAATAHDLRQPLSAVKMSLQLIRERLAGRPEAGDVDVALKNVDRIEALVERTRNLFAASRGVERIRLGELVEELAGTLGWCAGRDGGMRLEIHPGAEAPPVRGDRMLIEQLITNLVCNARDAVAAGGGGRVAIAVRRAQGREGAELVVADDGCGVKAEDTARLFEPFFTTKAAGRGTGLGLYVVRRVAEDHGGEVGLMDAEALAGLGLGRLVTGFRVWFPPPAQRDSIPSAGPRAISAAPPGGRRALVVDDEPTVRRLLGRVLEGEGFACVLCETGEAAIAEIERGGVTLVVADKNLPGISGIEVARLARRRDAATKVLIATGYPSAGSADEAMAIGVHGYLLKPLDVDALRAEVRGLCGEGERPSAAPAAPAAATGVLLIEPDPAIRRSIEAALAGTAFPVTARAEAAQLPAGDGDRILIARPETLERARGWLAARDGLTARGALAIMDRAGVDAIIEAIHLGARGVIAPPFDGEAVVSALTRVLAALEQEEERRR